jgi:hypothetical protein
MAIIPFAVLIACCVAWLWGATEMRKIALVLVMIFAVLILAALKN